MTLLLTFINMIDLIAKQSEAKQSEGAEGVFAEHRKAPSTCIDGNH